MSLSRGVRDRAPARDRPAILVFIYVPIALIVLYSFNAAGSAAWPIQSFTLDWYVEALSDTGHPGRAR